MTFKISAAQKKRRSQITDDLREKGQTLIEAVKAFNQSMEDAREFINLDLVGHFQEEYDEKSDNWQEGDRGSATSDWINTLDESAGELQDIAEDFDEEELERLIAILDDLPEEPAYD